MPKVNKELNTSVGPLPIGWYEVFPTVYDITTTKKGDPMLVYNYLVRDDVEQQGKGRQIKFDNFVDIDSTQWRFTQAGLAAGLDEADYALEEWAKLFQGRPIRVKLGIREFNGNEYNEVKAFERSQVGGFLTPEKLQEVKNGASGSQGVSKAASKPTNDPFADNGQPIDISDEDLPF